jgi:pilus assembly protein Flp/PilA
LASDNRGLDYRSLSLGAHGQYPVFALTGAINVPLGLGAVTWGVPQKPWRIEFMREFLVSLIRDESGVTAIEYGLIAALIAVVIIVAVTLVGQELATTFDTIQGALKNANATEDGGGGGGGGEEEAP